MTATSNCWSISRPPVHTSYHSPSRPLPLPNQTARCGTPAQRFLPSRTAPIPEAQYRWWVARRSRCRDRRQTSERLRQLRPSLLLLEPVGSRKEPFLDVAQKSAVPDSVLSSFGQPGCRLSALLLQRLHKCVEDFPLHINSLRAQTDLPCIQKHGIG